MTYCQTCRQENEPGANFCRSCGHRLAQVQTSYAAEEYKPPRPYVWKTDEFQINSYSAPKTQEIKQVESFKQPGVNQNTAASVYNPPPNRYLSRYGCPRCGTNKMPFMKRQISTADG